MDQTSRIHYEALFELRYLKLKGDAFQDFFCEIMERGYPGAFQRVRPWGKLGDRKNDGYLKTKRILFQSHAPDDPTKPLTQKAIVKKIEEDFLGALPHWQAYFGTWAFVHNSRDGLGPEADAKLKQLERDHPPIVTETWGFAELHREMFQLKDADVAALLGAPLSNQAWARLGYMELQPVLTAVSKREPALTGSIVPVPPDKIRTNALSQGIERFLELGQEKASLVDDFFAHWHDPTLGDQVAEALKREYDSLKASGLVPDEIFGALREFVGGRGVWDANREAAVLAVLAYYFTHCDIFERPPSRSA